MVVWRDSSTRHIQTLFWSDQMFFTCEKNKNHRCSKIVWDWRVQSEILQLHMCLPVCVVGTWPKVATVKGREFTLQEQQKMISHHEEVFATGRKILNRSHQLLPWIWVLRVLPSVWRRHNFKNWRQQLSLSLKWKQWLFLF